ncbi:GNAT family N-acetyltransferase [candidate division WOR-3 bacterium]|nr:GNAT family N-acetyltransferase [candidate division WOR-3 bacterium]
MARAFARDPLWTWVFPDRARRERGCRAVFSFYLRLGFACGAVDAAPGLEGVAMWLHGGPFHPDLSLLGPGLALPARLGLASLRRLIAAESTNAALRHRIVGGPYLYLAELAVAPGHQRRGVGTALVRHGLARTSLPCCVETQSGANVPFYQRLGFELRANSIIPGSGIQVFALLRPGRRPAGL